MSATSSSWFVRLRPRPDAAIRLFCFPSAGAGASVYGRWSEDLPGDIEAWACQLPGRETRRLEASFTDIQAIADECVHLIQPLLDRPFAFFGHSMGALVSFELALRLAERGTRPLAVFFSGRAAPHISRGYDGIESLSDEQFLDRMDTMFGGVPELLRTDAEFRDLYLPPLRADVTAVARYRPVGAPRLEFPVHVLGGNEDHSVPREALDAWHTYASGDFRVDGFPGGHFYVYNDRKAVIAFVVDELAKRKRSGEPAVLDARHAHSGGSDR